MQTLVRILRWVIGKAVPGLLLAGLTLGAGGYWQYRRDAGNFAAAREARLHELGGERDRLQQALAGVAARLDRISAELTAERERARQAGKIVAELKDLESTWDRLVANREQQKANAEQQARMALVQQDAADRAAARQEEIRRTTWERDGLELSLTDVQGRYQAAEASRSMPAHYLGLAWDRLKWWLVAGLGLFYVGWPVFRYWRWLRSDQD